MNKRALLLIVIMLIPLIAQKEQDEVPADIHVQTGLVLEIKENQINFEEMWMNVLSPQVKNAQPVIIVDALEQPLTYADLIAPCQVELTYTYDEGRKAYVPMKIKILEQYEFDDQGFIITE